MAVSVIILTYNSQATIAATLESARCVSDDIHVVDSFSNDDTATIAREFGAHFVQHEFDHYGAQRNWAMDTLDLKYDWELHLDADERLSDTLVGEINRLFPELLKASAPQPPTELTGVTEGPVTGYFIPRLVHFMDRPIRHGGMYPIYHMRLFRRGYGRCEDRRYDQHFLVSGRTALLDAPMIDDMRLDLDEWMSRHMRWAEAEAQEYLSPGDEGVIAGNLNGTPVERKRALRRYYDRQPLFLRAFGLFLYRYIWRGGFLDGREGLIFFTIQTFWFRFLVDVKIYEKRKTNDEQGTADDGG
ncbi:MAG: glycosyltransferase family 2 protein [Alphaproteobacteria bacterium]|nr:glycosyltransferase family 2 protein [Alphaproteobacteria bacterium]